MTKDVIKKELRVIVIIKIARMRNLYQLREIYRILQVIPV